MRLALIVCIRIYQDCKGITLTKSAVYIKNYQNQAYLLPSQQFFILVLINLESLLFGNIYGQTSKKYLKIIKMQPHFISKQIFWEVF